MDPRSSLPDYVEMGRHTYWDPNNIRLLTYVPGEKIVIGKYCSIAAGVTLCTGGNHATDTVSTWPFDNFWLDRPNPTRTYRTTRNTTVGHDVWLGYGAHVLGGARVGHGAVVAARAVVFADVPDYAVVAGNPAQVVRYRFSQPIVRRLLRIAWWDWPDEVVRANLEWFYRPVREFVEHFDPCGEGADGDAARAA
jgi:acetyltransferase-like isoleucine patch superfamily enzyme